MKSISIALATLVAGCAGAPQAMAPAAEPMAGEAAPEYHSAFAEYQGFAEQELAPWREANEEVRSAGGHIGILKSQGGHK